MKSSSPKSAEFQCNWTIQAPNNITSMDFFNVRWRKEKLFDRQRFEMPYDWKFTGIKLCEWLTTKKMNKLSYIPSHVYNRNFIDFSVENSKRELVWFHWCGWECGQEEKHTKWIRILYFIVVALFSLSADQFTACTSINAYISINITVRMR